MSMNMAAKHAVGRKLKDAIFEASKACQDAIKIHGAGKVTNATIGVVLDDAGKLSVLPTVEKVFRSMEMSDFTAYAPIVGMPDYVSAVKNIVFENRTCENYFDAVATSGGTGAIHHAVANYAERGEKVLTSDWCWGTYKIICDETGKTLETFKMFNEDLTGFNVESFSDKVEEILKTQNSLLMILNTPAHNPTGYALSSDEWDKVLDVIKNHAANGKKISLLVDVAYIEFSADKKAAWSFVDKFKNLPENILIMLSFSMSKSYTLYGQRTGALAAISSSREVIEEFKETNKFSCRACWSNINHGAQALLTKFDKNENFRRELEEDQKNLREMVNNRAEIFVKDAEECGLKIVPYRGGFFIAVPTENPAAVAEKLHDDLIFAVPLKFGLRVAACSVPAEKMHGVAQKIKSAIDSLK
ncbi:MAG: aminotransferase class I/II-fold pyridoxal phosphate-dependent enzyme [Selenomonadaceae bacterium]|nr:aminotransferase class I/II-fold pyridoxal phosphate-dependent enzyme [Selenomonadaceae bacterium]